MTIKITGLTGLQAALNATPKQLARIERNVVNRTLTKADQETIKLIAAETGLKRKEQTKRRTVHRAKQGQTEGRISASDSTISLSRYRRRLKKTSKTRARVAVKDEVGKPERISGSAFVNPKFNRKKPFRRDADVDRLPIEAAQGASLAVNHQHVYDDIGFSDGINKFFFSEFRKDLRKVLR